MPTARAATARPPSASPRTDTERLLARVSRIEATFDLLFRGFFERSTRFLPAHNCISKVSREALPAQKPFFEKDQQDVFRIAT
ncbi:MAG: hypothetical protein JSW36_09555 [Burkholderiales bacterium]|nr:MAG: hypothetical protein JSW36_09555 [Burkholderiales bacterium]